MIDLPKVSLNKIVKFVRCFDRAGCDASFLR